MWGTLASLSSGARSVGWRSLRRCLGAVTPGRPRWAGVGAPRVGSPGGRGESPARSRWPSSPLSAPALLAVEPSAAALVGAKRANDCGAGAHRTFTAGPSESSTIKGVARAGSRRAEVQGRAAGLAGATSTFACSAAVRAACPHRDPMRIIAAERGGSEPSPNLWSTGARPESRLAAGGPCSSPRHSVTLREMPRRSGRRPASGAGPRDGYAEGGLRLELRSEHPRAPRGSVSRRFGPRRRG